MLYTVNDDCRLCGETGRDHTDDCPGKVIETLRFSVQVTGSNCGRGCCGYTDTHVTGDTREEAIANALADAGYNARHNVYISYRSEEETCTAEYKALADAKYGAKRRQEEAERQANERMDRRRQMNEYFNILAKEKDDLLPEAYLRRYDAIKEKYKDVWEG